MNSNLNNTIYDADVYLRLSKEDGDKAESESIVNQKKLIEEYLKKHPEIRVHQFRVDDGYTGVNFNRPAFQEMIEDVKQGIVTCIIVKDLSRFGRNYVEVGRYIEKIFPYLGVRFIAINDNYDSSRDDKQTDNIIIPFKNLINDAYCRDISVKVRSQLEVKRINGDFIGSFAPYGYKKSEENKNALVVDEFAADIVRDIFKYFLQGYSPYKIAGFMNKLGILTPMDYKNENGDNFYTSFKVVEHSLWNHVTVKRILQNEVYLGTVVQGKFTTPNHKVKKKKMISPALWTKVGGMHEAIISKAEFHLVSKLLQMDTKTSPKEASLYALAGLIKCGDCNNNMVKKVVPSGKKKYQYYVCGGYKYSKSCTSHSISLPKLEGCVLEMLNLHIEQLVLLEEVIKKVEQNPNQKLVEKKRRELVQAKQNEIKRYSEFKVSLYQDYQEEILTKEEYLELKEVYTEKIEGLIEEQERVADEGFSLSLGSSQHEWIQTFKEFGKINVLTRELAVMLIEEILIYDKDRIEVRFNYQDEYNQKLQLLEGLDASQGNMSEHVIGGM